MKVMKVCIIDLVCQVKGEGMKCGLVEGVKHNTLMVWPQGNMERMAESEMTKRVQSLRIVSVFLVRDSLCIRATKKK